MTANPKDVPQHYYSLEEYFAREDASFEYRDGDIICMSGGSGAHGTIGSNVVSTRGRSSLLNEPCVVRHTRLESGDWERRDVTDFDASLELESIGCAVRLRDIYDGVTFNA